jgi:hypothetical protein
MGFKVAAKTSTGTETYFATGKKVPDNVEAMKVSERIEMF